jgi:cell division septum initiation protein DivIVA
MISTRIDGSAPSNQIFDLLTVVSNPEVYQAKLKKLEDAIEENKKFVALVGPASDVLALKKKAQDGLAEAEKALADAKTKAQGMIADAASEATLIVSKAKAESDDVLGAAKAKESEVAAALKDAKAAEASAFKAQTDAETQSVRAQAKAVELQEKIEAAEAERAKYETLRAQLISKHQAFIASL